MSAGNERGLHSMTSAQAQNQQEVADPSAILAEPPVLRKGKGNEGASDGRARRCYSQSTT